MHVPLIQRWEANAVNCAGRRGDGGSGGGGGGEVVWQVIIDDRVSEVATSLLCMRWNLLRYQPHDSNIVLTVGLTLSVRLSISPLSIHRPWV